MKTYPEMLEIINFRNEVIKEESEVYNNPLDYNTWYNNCWVHDYSTKLYEMAHGCTEMERIYSECEKYITNRANRK